MDLNSEQWEALQAKNGTREIAFRCDVMRGFVKTREITVDGSISWSLDDEIGRTARLTLYEPLDWLHETLMPYLRVKVPRKLGRHGLTVGEINEAHLTVGTINQMQLSPGDFGGWILDGERKILTVGQINAMQLTVGEINAMKLRVGEFLPEPTDQWAEFPLGLLVPATPKKQMDENGKVSWEVECYDGVIRLRQDCLTDLLYFAAGTPYIQAVQAVLVSAGISSVIVADPSGVELPTDREFDTGTPKLEIVNTLLSEINYNNIRCDASGNFVISRYYEPSADRISVTYQGDRLSIIRQQMAVESDYFDVPNHWICVVSNPDQEEIYRSEYINDNSESPLSTVSRGIHLVKMVDGPDVVASQEELDAYVARVAFAEMQIFEIITFSTAIMPHDALEIIALMHPGASGIYQETGWTIPLEAGQEMNHTARRISLE